MNKLLFLLFLSVPALAQKNIYTGHYNLSKEDYRGSDEYVYGDTVFSEIYFSSDSFLMIYHIKDIKGNDGLKLLTGTWNLSSLSVSLHFQTGAILSGVFSSIPMGKSALPICSFNNNTYYLVKPKSIHTIDEISQPKKPYQFAMYPLSGTYNGTDTLSGNICFFNTDSFLIVYQLVLNNDNILRLYRGKWEQGSSNFILYQDDGMKHISKFRIYNEDPGSKDGVIQPFRATAVVLEDGGK